LHKMLRLTAVFFLVMAAPVILAGCFSSPASPAASTRTAASSIPPVTSASPAAGSKPSATPASEPLKIGLISSLSGPFEAAVSYQQTAVEMVVDDINAAGGLLGRKIEIVVRDDQADPGLVPQKLNELKAAGCPAIIGSALDRISPPERQWARDNHIPIVTTGSTSFSERVEFNPYVFQVSPPSLALTRATARSLYRQNIKSVYFILADDSFCREVYNLFWPAMRILDSDVVELGVSRMGARDMDFTNTIRTALSQRPEFTYIGLTGQAYTKFVQQAAHLNFYSQTKNGSATHLLDAELVGPFGDTYPAGVQSVSWCPYWLDDPQIRAFKEAFYARTQLNPADITMLYYLAALSVTGAIQAADSIDPEAIVKACETLSIDAPQGKLSFRDFDHQLNTPVWWFSSGYSPDYPLAIGVNGYKFGDEVFPAEKEMLSLRAP
jgi:branched-chain amino acid transport system substrate-binding protein